MSKRFVYWVNIAILVLLLAWYVWTVWLQQGVQP